MTGFLTICGRNDLAIAVEDYWRSKDQSHFKELVHLILSGSADFIWNWGDAGREIAIISNTEAII